MIRIAGPIWSSTVTVRKRSSRRSYSRPPSLITYPAPPGKRKSWPARTPVIRSKSQSDQRAELQVSTLRAATTNAGTAAIGCPRRRSTARAITKSHRTSPHLPEELHRFVKQVTYLQQKCRLHVSLHALRYSS